MKHFRQEFIYGHAEWNKTRRMIGWIFYFTFNVDIIHSLSRYMLLQGSHSIAMFAAHALRESNSHVYVELSPAVDVPVTVNTVWTGPAGFSTTNTAQPVMGSTTTYTSIATVRSFRRDQSGNYICIATVISVSPFIAYSSLSGVTRITTGKSASLS